MTMIYSVVGGFIRLFLYFENGLEKFNLKQRVFVTIVCGPLAWAVAFVLYPLGFIIQYLWFKILDSLADKPDTNEKELKLTTSGELLEKKYKNCK